MLLRQEKNLIDLIIRWHTLCTAYEQHMHSVSAAHRRHRMQVHCNMHICNWKQLACPKFFTACLYAIQCHGIACYIIHHDDVLPSLFSAVHRLRALFACMPLPLLHAATSQGGSKPRSTLCLPGRQASASAPALINHDVCMSNPKPPFHISC